MHTTTTHTAAGPETGAETEGAQPAAALSIIVSRTISAVEAAVDGDNTLAALELAGRLTTHTPEATIALIGPGLSDQASLDLTVRSVASADPKEVTAQLRNLKALPALTGRTIDWYGLGERQHPSGKDGSPSITPPPDRG